MYFIYQKLATWVECFNYSTKSELHFELILLYDISYLFPLKLNYLVSITYSNLRITNGDHCSNIYLVVHFILLHYYKTNIVVLYTDNSHLSILQWWSSWSEMHFFCQYCFQYAQSDVISDPRCCCSFC